MEKELLQIVCFKLLKSQLEEIDNLVLRRLYFSRSEVLRLAIRSLLRRMTEDKLLTGRNKISYYGSYYSGYSSSLNRESMNGTKNSISSKLPMNLLHVIDQIVAKEYFESRSQFIREAVNNYLDGNKGLHEAFDA